MSEHAQKCRTKDVNFAAGNVIPRECDCDGYHTFTELYDHRITLYIALCRVLANVPHETDMPQCWCNPRKEVVEGGNMVIVHNSIIWRSRKHSDGGAWDGWFILGIGTEPGEQITYHLPISRWQETDFFAEELENAPEWDGHTSDDVLDRLKNL